MTRMELRDRLAEQFGELLERWARLERRNRNIFVPAYAEILPNILNLVLDANLKRQRRVQRDCEDLTDDDRAIAVCIRTNADAPQARKTLDRYKGPLLNGRCKRLVILVLATSLHSLRESLERDTFFSAERDLWSLEDLYHRIREQDDLEKTEKICGHLDQLLAVPFEEPQNLLRPVPWYTENFVGREAELFLLRNKLDEKKPIFITGIGGIGKTEIALKMAHEFTPPKGAYLIRYDNSIDEENEVIRQLILKADFSGYPSYTEDCRHPEQDYAARMQLLREQYQGALLIIDNLDLQKKTVQDVQQEDSYRDLVNSGVNLVFTTRYATDGVDIGPMDSVVLLELIRKFYTYPADAQGELLELIKTVHGHTQTVVQMAQTMGRSWGRIKPEDFIHSFEDRLEFRSKNTSRDLIRKEKLYSGPYPRVNMDRNGEFSSRNIYDHLSDVFRLSGLSELNQTILRYATLLPDEGLYEDLFRKAMAKCRQEDDELFANAYIAENIDSVAARGWLQKANGVLMIHPVMRNVYLRELKPVDENCEDFLDALWLQYKPKEYSKKTYRQLAKLFQMATNKLEDREGIWCLRAGLFWNRLGEVDQALECFLKTVERQKTSTDNTVDLVRTYNKIGSAYQALDKLPEAQVNFRRALAVAEKNPKTDQYTLAMTLTNLGSVYGDLGDYESALENRMRALEILKGYYPKNHPALAVSYSNLGSVFSANGDYKTSLRCYLKALEIREEQSTSDSDEDLDLAKTYNNVGGNYFRLRDYMKAQDYLLKAMLIRERLLPDGHPDLVRSYNNMGGLYMRMGDDKKALEYLLKALKLRNQASLDEYLGLATIHNNIAAIYTKMGDFEQGLDNLLEALSLQEKIDPPKRPDIAQTHSNIAWTYYGMGNYQKAEEHIRKAVMIAEEVLPPKHTDLDMYYRAESRFREKRQIYEGAN